MSNNSKKPSSAKKKPWLVFYYTDPVVGEKKAGLTKKLCSGVPVLQELCHGGEYHLILTTSVKVVATYFKTLNLRLSNELDGIPAQLSGFSADQWNALFWLAFTLQDELFYTTLTPWFPALTVIAPLVLKMPEPARLFYFGCYLATCFKLVCTCDRTRVKQLKRDARAWFKGLKSDTERTKYEKTPPAGVWRVVKAQLGHTYDDLKERQEDWEAENYNALDREVMFNWYTLERPVQTHLLYATVEVPACTCSREHFTRVWLKFCTLDKDIAKFLWTHMERDQLARYTKSGDPKRDKVALRKKTFEEMTNYIEYIKNG